MAGLSLMRLLILLVSASILGGCAPPEPYRIGFLGGISGRYADLGIGGRNGAALAIEMRNAAGGINGRRSSLSSRTTSRIPTLPGRRFRG